MQLQSQQNERQDQTETDEQLAVSVQNGQIQKFEILVERYKRRLESYGKKMLFNTSDLEDHLQDIFIKVYQNLNSFDADRKFSSWIYRIAHNEFINHGLKKSRSLTDYFDLETFFPNLRGEKGPEHEMSKQELKELLEKSLSDLESKYREPLYLFLYEEMSYQEISDILKIPTNTVGVRILRGKQILKASLKPKL